MIRDQAIKRLPNDPPHAGAIPWPQYDEAHVVKCAFFEVTGIFVWQLQHVWPIDIQRRLL